MVVKRADKKSAPRLPKKAFHRGMWTANEEQLFSDSGCYVSTARIVAGAATYDVRWVSSVRVCPPAPSSGVVSLIMGLMGLAALAGGCGYFYGEMGCSASGQQEAYRGAAITALVVVALFASEVLTIRRTRLVVIGTPSGEQVIARTKNAAWADALAAAIRAAVDRSRSLPSA